MTNWEISTFAGDKFFEELSVDEQEELLDTLRSGRPTPTTLGSDIWVGEIHYCPACEGIRITSCCACGCGECKTCGYLWRCT